MTGDAQTPHWDGVYEAREEDALTWFEEVPEVSLRLIGRFAEPGDPVIDIGGGASRLVDHLMARGYRNLAVLDLSEAALEVSRARLGAAAEGVTWIAADVTRWHPEGAAHALWHDRAAFHFLTDPDQRAAYVGCMASALRPGGHAIMMSFAEDGPERCSGLPVQRYSPATLATEIARHRPGAFTPVLAERHLHHTPKGAVQAFQVSVLRRNGDG